MSNKISNFLGFEKLRDGGSLTASFRSHDSCEYWVLFPVANKKIENPKFSNPILVNKTTGIEVDLSLDGARIWLQNLSPYIDKWLDKTGVSKEDEIAILNKMLELCKVNKYTSI